MEFVNICSLSLLLVAQLIQFKHVFIPLVGWPCSFQGWIDPISAAPVLPSEWQLLMFQTSVNCRIQFRKHLVSTPVARYPRHLYPCLSWGSLQLPDNLWLYLVSQVSAMHWQFTCFVIGFQCKIPFLLRMYRKLYLLKYLSSLTSLIVQILIFLSRSIFQVSLFCSSKRTENYKELLHCFFFPLKKIPLHSDMFLFPNFPFFPDTHIVLIHGKYGTK